jgi:hypothetical protein
MFKTLTFQRGQACWFQGPPDFINSILLDLSLTCCVIALVLFWLHSLSVRSMRKDQATAKKMLNWHDLCVVSFLDSDNGGARDACYMVGFGGDLVSDVLPGSMMGLPWTLCHFLGGGTVGFFPLEARIPCLSIPTSKAPPQKVLWHLDGVLGEVLFPSSRPMSEVYCPSHFFPHGSGFSNHSLFPSCCVFISCHSVWTHCSGVCPWSTGCRSRILHLPTCLSQFFGSCGGMVLGGGGLSESVSPETPPNVDVDNIAGMGVEVVEGTVETKEAREEIVEVEDVVKGGSWMSVGDETATTVLIMASMSLGLGQCNETLRAAHPPREMTATQLDTQQGAGPITSPTRRFEFDFGDMFVDISKPLMDKDMVTSAASAKMLRGRTSCRA